MSIHRVQTGIPNLDELIEGGLPDNSLILLVGYPGAGKTTFSSQFLHTGAGKFRSRGVYVCFAETKRSFLRNALRFGWDFERLEKEDRVHILDLSVTREAGLQANLNTIMEKIDEIKANRLVIDSFTAITMALKEPADIRVMLHLLYKFLQTINCITVLIVDKPWGADSIGGGIAEFIADGIILLETEFDDGGVLRRKMRILKMRGTDHTKETHSYDITKAGFTVTPLKK